jgi:hypothetical protein
MKINKTYRSLLDKSINSMLSAIEIYNKPNFNYREETFAILAVNSWELLFKAELLKSSNYKIKSLYILEPVLKKDKTPSTRFKPKLNRSKNPITVSLFEAIERLRKKSKAINQNLFKSIESIVELRDNAIHFHNEKAISKQLQELGFACIKNYMNLIKEWKIDIDLSQYNFYLMPLAYVDSKIESEAILTDSEIKYIDFLKDKIKDSDNTDNKYDVAISIDISFKKSNSIEGIGMKYDKDGVPITITEENMTKNFPYTYRDLIEEAQKRYISFKRDKVFNSLMKGIQNNEKLCYHRKHNPKSKTSSTTKFYGTNIWQELDKYYIKK